MIFDDCTAPVAQTDEGGATGTPNPYSHIKIFRRDLMSSDSFSANLSVPLSADISAKKLRDFFSDPETKRCRLCNESYMHYSTHANFIPHAGREALAMELLRPYCGTPDEISAMWWHRLHHSKCFRRIPSLSHDNGHQRKRRLQYLLQFLKDLKVIRETFSVNKTEGLQVSAGRSWNFERLEWVGDNVIKYLFNDRINVLFPFHEGGVKGRLSYTQFVVDGNESLARAYDHLELQQLTQSDRVVSKFKADVVETLFGELQVYLWSTEEDVGTEYFRLPFTPEMLPLRSVVEHVMDELGHVMIMYHIEYIIGVIKRIMHEHQVSFVRSDPAQREEDAKRGIRPGGGTSFKNMKKVSQMRQTHPRAHDGPALFLAITNYEGFKKVPSLAGLLPQPFPQHVLTPTCAFLPHLQQLPAPKTVKSCLEAVMNSSEKKFHVGSNDSGDSMRPSLTPVPLKVLSSASGTPPPCLPALLSIF
jgi:hypothetical protein